MSKNLMDKKLEAEIKGLYKKWPEIKRFLANFGCSSKDAEDVFQEALIIYVRKKSEVNFELHVEPYHYVKSTCKLLWYNEARKQQKKPQTNLLEEADKAIESTWFQKELKIKSIENAITQLGKQCKEILELFYGLNWNMIDIAKKIGLRNENVVKTQKYRCLQKAKELSQKEFDNAVEHNFSH